MPGRLFPGLMLSFHMAGKIDKPSSRVALALTASEQRDKLIKEIVEKERAEADAKTVRLRALRLARDAELAAQPKSKTKTTQ
jgi:hypothetical protein